MTSPLKVPPTMMLVLVWSMTIAPKCTELMLPGPLLAPASGPASLTQLVVLARPAAF